MPTTPLDAPPPPTVRGDFWCSAKGCRRAAVWGLYWNNPKLHEPDRRKAWLACDAHKQTLGDFLAARGFLRETRALTEPAPEGA